MLRIVLSRYSLFLLVQEARISSSPAQGLKLQQLPQAEDQETQLPHSTTLSLSAVSGAQSLVRILHINSYNTPLKVPACTAPEQFRTVGQRVGIPGQRDHLGWRVKFYLHL